MRPRLNTPGVSILLVVLLVGTFFYFIRDSRQPSEITYDQLRVQLQEDNIADVEFNDSQLYGKFRKPPKLEVLKTTPAGKQLEQLQLKDEFLVVLPPLVGEDLLRELLVKKVHIKAQHPADSTAFCCSCTWRSPSCYSLAFG